MTERTTPRLEPLPRERWDDDAVAAVRGAFPAKVVDAFLAPGPDAPPVPNVLAALMHHPSLGGPFLAYNSVLLREPALGARYRELMVLRVAWRTRSRYEWVQHVRLAERYGITRDDIDAITRDGTAAGWTPLERDLVAATDQMLDHYRIADETWKRLAAQLDERQLVEIPFVVGTYTCLAMALNSFGVDLEDNIDANVAPPLPD